MYPSGRQSLPTTPVPTGSATVVKTTSIIDVACLAARVAAVPAVGAAGCDLRSRTNSAAISDMRPPLAFRPSILDQDSTSFDPIEFPQPLNKCRGPFSLVGRCSKSLEIRQSGAYRHLKRAMYQGQRHHCAPKSTDEFPPPSCLSPGQFRRRFVSAHTYECFDTKPASLLQHEMPADVRVGNSRSIWPRTDNFRSAPTNRHRYCVSACLKGANSPMSQRCQ